VAATFELTIQFIQHESRALLAALPALKEKLGVTVEASTIAGVKVFIVTPSVIPRANQNRLLMHLHAYGVLFMPGESATTEAVMILGISAFKVISIDYPTRTRPIQRRWTTP